MGIQKGLASIQGYREEQDRKREAAAGPKTNWLGIKDKEVVKVRFLQELDEGAANYSEKNGLGFFATEHSSPADYRKKALCSMDDEEQCFGCEQHRLDWKAGWKAKSRLYINVLVKRADGTEEVAVMSQSNGPKAVIAASVLEYAVENNTLTDRWWRITRTGSKADDTTYTTFIFGPDDDVKIEDYEVQDLDRCVRVIPYAEQEAFFLGAATRPSEATSEGIAALAAPKGSGQDEAW